jgi:hypothetical protein
MWTRRSTTEYYLDGEITKNCPQPHLPADNITYIVTCCRSVQTGPTVDTLSGGRKSTQNFLEDLNLEFPTSQENLRGTQAVFRRRVTREGSETDKKKAKSDHQINVRLSSEKFSLLGDVSAATKPIFQECLKNDES